MSASVLTGRLGAHAVADKALKAAVWLWFVVAVIGQYVFAFTIASFYGLTAARGNLLAWNKVLPNGYVAGNSIGNAALAAHLLFAATITLSGALQLIPRIRARFPVFHRWNGRMYVLIAFSMAISGLYLATSRRHVIGDVTQHIGIEINAILIIICAALALRFALARDFTTHRRWALRLFLVVSASWFFRIGLFLSLLLFHGPVGYDPTSFQGPFLTFLSFAEYLLPLAILELYLRTQDRPGAPRRIAMATGLFVLTLAMGAGIMGATTGLWLPRIKTAYDSRKSIADTLSATITSRGVDAAVQQYRAFKAAAPATYNFDEAELNALGYQLIQAHKLKDAVRIFQLNVEAYPQSSNVYDSLAEAYMDDGDNTQAVASYQASLRLDQNNRNAVQMIRKLNAP
jgi:uncharacterized membrane protein